MTWLSVLVLLITMVAVWLLLRDVGKLQSEQPKVVGKHRAQIPAQRNSHHVAKHRNSAA